MTGIPPDLCEKMQRPAGTLGFRYTSEALFSPTAQAGKILECISRGQVHLLDRDDNLYLRFLHWSPGTGTRVATVDLKDITSHKEVGMYIGWSPDEIRLDVLTGGAEIEHHEAIGEESPIQLSVAEDGSVYQIGGSDISVMGFSVFERGQAVALPTAIKSWKDTHLAIQLFLDALNDVKQPASFISGNLVLVMIVTGLENYWKTRFVEIDDEGTPCSLKYMMNL